MEWEDESGETKEGVYVFRRDTNSRFDVLTSGRIFPEVQNLSGFQVADAGGEISIRVQPAQEAAPLIDFKVSETDQFPADSVFRSLHEASRIFETEHIGHSSQLNSRKLDGLQLKATDWEVSPLKIHRMSSSYYDDLSLFPKGSIELDHALLMRDIPHEWHSEPEISPE